MTLAKNIWWFSLVLIAGSVPLSAAEKLKALIVDGQNNHLVWPKSSVMMRQYLEETGLFEVDVARTRYHLEVRPRKGLAATRGGRGLGGSPGAQA